MNIEVKKLKMTKDVIEGIIDVDKTFYFDMDYSTNDWYLNRYNENCDVTVLVANGVIVGYFIFYGISEKLFNDIYNLKYDNDYSFDNSDVDLNSDIKYFASVLVKKEFRELCSPLILELERQFEKLNKVVAIAISKEGNKMCSRCMNFVGCVNGKANVYVKDKK